MNRQTTTMDEPFLVVISLTMFVGSYLAGCIPLFFTLNERGIRIASIFGAGLLVGTALCVIIPEGVSTLVESNHVHQQNRIPVVPNPGPASEQIMGKTEIQVPANAMEQKQQREKKELFLDDYKRAGATSFEPKSEISSENGKHPLNRRQIIKREVASGMEPINGHHNDEQKSQRLDGQIGVSLLVGFLFMFVVDQLAKISTHGRHKSLSTLGLVIHAFADGIAMGSASSAGSQMELQILVFVAIMLHKAPAAFALVSILLAHGLEKSRIRRHLLAFSLAAPIGTLLTYALLHTAQTNVPLRSDGPTEAEASSHITGIILLFSAGTFLYIATVHVLPELIESKCGNMASSGMSGSRELLLGGNASGLAGPISRLSLFDICLFCISALIPALISSASHGHGH